MKTRTKMLIDSAIAEPAAWGLNVLARMAGGLARRDHRVDAQSVRTIVVVKLLGMGSIIQSTPLLAALKKRFPNARIILLTTATQKELVERLAHVDEAVYIDDRSLSSLVEGTTAAIVTLLRRGVDLYFDLEVYSAGTSIIGLLSLARNRYGLYRNTARFKNGICTHLVYFNVRMPVARIYLQLNLASGGDAQEIEALGPLIIRADDELGGRSKLKRAGMGDDAPYIVVNPNASDLLLERRWPKDSFVATIRELAERGHNTVLIGAPNEAAYVSALYEDIPQASRAKVANLAGQLTLGELFAVMSKARCVVTNDTGPMHIAFALNRPTVCLFGPSHPETYALLRHNIEILYRPVFCSPCAHELDAPPCAGDNVCMQLITPGDVVGSVLRLIGEGQPEKNGDARRVLRVLNADTTYVDGLGRGLGIAARASLADARPTRKPQHPRGAPRG